MGFYRILWKCEGVKRPPEKIQVGNWTQLVGNEDLYGLGVGWGFIHIQFADAEELRHVKEEVV